MPQGRYVMVSGFPSIFLLENSWIRLEPRICCVLNPLVAPATSHQRPLGLPL